MIDAPDSVAQSTLDDLRRRLLDTNSVRLPAGTIFPFDLVTAPRSFAERFFNVRVWDEEPSGGHFAAWERPERFVAGMRAAVALAT